MNARNTLTPFQRRVTTRLQRGCNFLDLPWARVTNLRSLRLLAKRYRKLQERICSEDNSRLPRLLELTEQKIDKQCRALGVHYYLQSDCRGAALYLSTKPIPENNYTSAGFCVDAE